MFAPFAMSFLLELMYGEVKNSLEHLPFIQLIYRGKLFCKYYALVQEDKEEELVEFDRKLQDIKRYEVVFESAAQAALQISIVLITGMTLNQFFLNTKIIKYRIVPRVSN